MKALRWYENYLLPVTNLWKSVRIYAKTLQIY